MYYRQKVLLSLVKSFGGSLSNTDCHKLMFMLSQRTGSKHYEFFPYQYGSFSYILYNDKRLLIEERHLKDQDRYTLYGKDDKLSWINLKSKDLQGINDLKREIGDLRGKRLIKKVYKEYPQFAVKSKIVSEVLAPEEIEKIRSSNKEENSMSLFTIGYEGKSIDGYLNQLIRNSIKLVIDVRNNPNSRKFGFSKSKFQYYLEQSEIDYIHLPELGIPYNLRKNLNGFESYSKLFKTYSAQIIPSQTAAMERIRHHLDSHKRIALTCFEADFQFCHRSQITNFFEQDLTFSSPIIHLN